MPKVIQPRRHDKQLSVQEFWKIKEYGRQNVQIKSFTPAYKEEQVRLRNRYLRPSERAKIFNPLTLILKRQIKEESNSMYDIADDQNTHISDYISQVQYKVHPFLVPIKKYVQGRKSIIYNIEKIYELLFNHLEIDQSWTLLQVIMKDAKNERFDIWMKEGLKKIAAIIEDKAGLDFNEIFFKNLFNTICVLMENYYESIVKYLKEYFLLFCDLFMKNTNKYIRRFSIQVFSYIFSNLDEQNYTFFINFLVEKQKENLFDDKVKLADLLIQRLNFVRGCLTTASLANFFDQLQILYKIFSEEDSGEASSFSQIASEYIFLLLKTVNNKQQINDDAKILFDFNYIVKGLIDFCNKDQYNVNIYSHILLKAFSSFIALYKTDKKKFTGFNSFQRTYLQKIWLIFSSFFKEKIEFFQETVSLNEAISILMVKNTTDNLFYDSQLIKYCKSSESIAAILINTLYEQQDEINDKLIEIILLLSKAFIQGFIVRDQHAQLIYRLIIIIKRVNLNKFIEFSWLQIDASQLISKFQRSYSQPDLIVTLRFLAFINVDSSLAAQLYAISAKIYHENMNEYEEFMEKMIRQHIDSQLSGNQFYNSSNFTKEIIQFSHHQIGWLSHIFNFYQAFSILDQHLLKINPEIKLNKNQSDIWNQLIISRPSAVQILKNNTKLSTQASKLLIQNLLSSRIREVRLNALELISRELQLQDSYESKIIKSLIEIDANAIDLDNERQIKRIFVNVEKMLTNFTQNMKDEMLAKTLLKILMKWSLGFAFTGFKLIQKSFISFFQIIINIDLKDNTPQTIVSNILSPFLSYYNYRHSRQYEYDVSPSSISKHITNAYQIEENHDLKAFIKEDLELIDVETVEWIGLQRISEAIKQSKKGKANIGVNLSEMIKAYFEIEFKRQKRSIEDPQETTSDQFLLPIKQRYLIIILKLCPNDILPPFKCLHFTRQEYFQVSKVKSIKKNKWQQMWQKKRNDHSKKKVEIAEISSTTINLQHLSPQQQELYVNYLWKDILESNRHKKRIILDHIRNYLPSASQLLIKLLFQYFCIDSLVEQMPNQQYIDIVVHRLRKFNRKNLLNGMFIMKAILLHMKQQITQENHLKQIFILILAIIQISYNYGQDKVSSIKDKEADNEQEEEEEINQEEEEEDEIEDDEQPQKGKNNEANLYKQHRKELQKLLQTLFSNHDLQTTTISSLLEYIFSNTKLNLTKTSRLSVPGLLLVLQIISEQKEFCQILVKIRDGQIIKMLTQMIHQDQNGGRPIKACSQIWLKIMDNILVKDTHLQEQVDIQIEYQSVINEDIKPYTQQMLEAIISFITGKDNKADIEGEVAKAPTYTNKNKEFQDSVKMLKIIAKIITLHTAPVQNRAWETYLWNQFNKLSKVKKQLSKDHCQKLSLLIIILTKYINLNQSLYDGDVISFLRKIINILPSIKETQLRAQILNLMVLHYRELGLNEEIVKIVLNLNKLKKVGLIITIDFTLFFEACNAYTASIHTFNMIDHEYFLNNIICYIDNEQLSIRRAVSTCNKSFLEQIQTKLNKNTQESPIEPPNKQKMQELIFIIIKLYRDYLNLLQKHFIQKNESIYWNIVEIIGLFYQWISINSIFISTIYPQSNFQLYPLLNNHNHEDFNYFKLLGSISEANKLKGLKSIRSMLEMMSPESKQLIKDWNPHTDFDVPNPLSKFILPVLEFLILKTTERHNNNTVKSNLSSTFSKSSYDLIPLVSSFLKESLVKKQLKRLISKLKFTENDHKKNMAVIKIISNVVDGIEGQQANEKLANFIEEHGFDQFHSKIAQYSKISTITKNENQDQSDNEYQTPKEKQKEKIPDYYDRLQELESQEAIHRNFMAFENKMMSIQDEQEEENKGLFSYFLKNQILTPLRAMLMMESKSKKEDQLAKGRILLSVTLTKVLLRLPLEVFLKEFQKIVGKLSRLLKKRQVQYRQNARNCLCQIAKSVGPQLLYAIILQLKFYLKDNFDKHVFNYTIFKILQSMNLKGGQLDYCLPLVLPMVIDQIFGRTGDQKDMVSKRQVPTLKIQAKKRKGLELIQLICKYVSHQKLNYIIQFLQKYLREHLVSQINLGKYDLMLGSISAGLSHNDSIISPIHAITLLESLSRPITKLRQSIKILKWDDKATHQNTLKRQWIRRKAGKEQILTLQEQAGRNGSIFKKMNKQIGELRNQEIIASSLTQFYLILISLFMRKHVFTLASTTSTTQSSNHMISLLSFLCECIDHRDNRLVTKSLKILHQSLKWNSADLTNDKQWISDKFKSLKKQTSKKILILIEQLTQSDVELLKQCFVFLNDLISDITLNLQILPNFITIIKLHIPTTADQPHLPETYDLLRTIICKCQQYIYHPLLDDLHRIIRMQLVTCYDKQIREIFKKILKFYLEPRQILQKSLEQFNRKKVNNNKQKLTYEKVIQEQITFYLSNLESTGNEAILQLLEEFIDNRDKGQLQTYAQLLILGMITARTNQVTIQRSSPLDNLIIKILKKIDQSKILQFVEKCLQWMKLQRKSSIRFCGSSLLRLILSSDSIKITKNIITKYIQSQDGILSRIAEILSQEVLQFEQDQDTKQNHKIQNKEWNNILNNMDVENMTYQCDKSIFQILLQLQPILQHYQQLSNQNALSRIVVNGWKLLRSNNSQLVNLIIDSFSKIKVLSTLLDQRENSQILFYNDKVKFSFKKTLIALIFNDIEKEKIETLLKQIIDEEHKIGQNHKLLEVGSWLFVGFAIKAHMKTKIYEKVLPNLLYLLNNVSLGQVYRQIIIKVQNFESKLLEMTVKLGSNQLISQESKSQTQSTTEIFKNLMGVGEYFKAVGEYQSKRREKKEDERIKIAQLAINDPQAFIEKKRQKQRKF